jgi:hypothetical protein
MLKNTCARKNWIVELLLEGKELRHCIKLVAYAYPAFADEEEVSCRVGFWGGNLSSH